MAIFNDNGGFSIAMFDRAVRMFKSSPVSEWRLLECRPNFPAARPLKIVSWIPGRSDLPGPTTLWTSLPHNINCPPRSERFIVLDLFIFLGGHSSGWYFSTWWLIPRIVSGLVHPSFLSGLTRSLSHVNRTLREKVAKMVMPKNLQLWPFISYNWFFLWD
jgi:hypothetical protein